jgi:heptosyltransferase-1
MRRILLVKTSSLGDVVHNLPVVSDLARAFPGVTVDWVAEETFAALPRLHPGVNAVIPVAVRRWRRAFLESTVRAEIRVFLSQLRAHSYDAVIDTQGLFKSALIARVAHGRRYGLDWHSSREPLRWFYDRTFRVPWTQHAVERNRSLVSQALGYALDSRLKYEISAPARQFDWLRTEHYAVLLHATSAERKLWPESHWVSLTKYLIKNNIFCILPWGNEGERARSERLHALTPEVIVPPRLSLEEAASLLASARAVAGVDTGLTHLAAALGTPTVSIYCATDPAATGIHGCARAVNLGGVNAVPSVADVCSALDRLMS